MGNMEETETRFMLMPHVRRGSEGDCADDVCTRKVMDGDNCFIDLLNNGAVLCEICGKCLRYARKCADRRGEPIETATQDR